MALEFVRPADLDHDGFRTRFPEIAVRVNWERFRADGWPVRVLRTTATADVLELFTCYRLSLGRVNAHFLHWLFSRNMTVSDVLKRYGRMPQRDRRIIESFVAEYREESLVKLELPTFGLPAGRQFLADGNHRIVALALAGVPFELDLYSVAAPPAARAFVGMANNRDRLFAPLRDRTPA